MRFLVLIVLLCVVHTRLISGAKILGFFATVSKSHFIVEEPVMRELAKRGHQVTVVSTFEQSGEPLENYRYVGIPDLNNNTEFQSFASGATKGNVLGFMEKLKVTEAIMRFSLNVMSHKTFQPIKDETFDLVVLGWVINEYALGLAGHFKCPSVVISPQVNFYFSRKLVGNPSSWSTVPSGFSNFNSPMTFLQRLQSFGYNLVEFLATEAIYYFYTQPMYLEAFPADKYPSYSEVAQNVSLVLLAQHFSGRTPEALLPGLIEVEGMHVKREPSPLPQDIKDFLDGATEGAIFFSLGSNAKGSDMSDEKIAILLNQFRSLKQKVLWKFETTLPGLPDNVKISKWLPQDDVLAHPNLKLFISHCGKGGITEAKYHGVPILGIPLFGDQFANADHIVAEGWAVKLPLENLNEASFSKSLDEILNNPKYAVAAQTLANLNRDRPEHPLDKAAFWIEYVIRHNGAKHMQSPAVHLNLLQYYMLDVYAFLMVTLYVLAKTLRILLKVLLRKVFGVGVKKVKKE